MDKKKVIVLISGRGSNLQSLIANAEDYEITYVISNKADAPGLDFAKEKSIPCKAFPRKDYESVDQQKAALFDFVKTLPLDFIALAGYMQIVPEDFANEYYGKIVNIHPSLLPKYPGLNTHKRALEAGDEEHGCSIIIVDAGVDTGPIIAQATCPIVLSDTPEKLADRLLVQEHQLYPWVLNMLCSENIIFNDNNVTYSEAAISEAHEAGFICPNN